MRKKLMMAGFLAAILLAMAGIISFASAENVGVQKGYVAVVVYDEHGNPLPNATVQILNNASQIVKTGVTGNDGRIIFNMNGVSNFTGVIKVTAKGYKVAEDNITYDTTANEGYSYVFHLEKNSSGYVDKAKDIYAQHKIAVIIGGGIVLLLALLMVFGRGKKVRW